MRRALITFTRLGGAPFAFGAATVAAGDTSPGTGYIQVDENSASPKAGTVNSITFYCASNATFTLVSGSLSGSSFTVRGVVDVASDGSGTQTRAISLPVLAGDYLGVWPQAGLTDFQSSGSGTIGFISTSTKPAPNDSYTIDFPGSGRNMLRASGVSG